MLARRLDAGPAQLWLLKLPGHAIAGLDRIVVKEELAVPKRFDQVVAKPSFTSAALVRSTSCSASARRLWLCKLPAQQRQPPLLLTQRKRQLGGCVIGAVHALELSQHVCNASSTVGRVHSASVRAARTFSILRLYFEVYFYTLKGTSSY